MPRVVYQCRRCNEPFYSRGGRLKHEKKHLRDNSNGTADSECESFGGNGMMDNDFFEEESSDRSSMQSDVQNTPQFDHMLIQNTLLDKLLQHAMVSETQHGVPRTSVDETLHLICDSIKYIGRNFDDDTREKIVNCIPSSSILLNDKKRDEEIAKRFFDCKPEEATYGEHTMYYLPLQGLLARLFKKKKNVEWVESSAQRRSDIGKYNDICDGSVVRDSEFFQKYDDALQFLLYLDECYLKDRTEYMMVYCTIGNFPIYTRCQLHNILPMAAIPTKLMKSAGDGILLPILSEFVPFASDGVDIKIYNNTYRKFRGQVVVVLLDHKAAHELGGFSTSFSNMKRFCRHCFLHRKDIGSTDQNKFTPRTPDVHDQIVAALESAVDVDGLKSMYGVQKYSVLNEIPNFHVITNLPPDLMHTEFEGELKQEFCSFLQYGTNNRWFTLAEFNHQLTSWRELLDLKSFVPVDISEKFSNNPSSNEVTAGQVYSLSTLLPFICTQFSSWADIRESVQFKSLMKHLEYLTICLQWSFTEPDLVKLDKLLKEHVQLWGEAYSHSYRPKSHYRLHFIEAIRAFGPLVGIYCMRYEAKHQLMKRFVSNSNNRNDARAILIKSLKHMATVDHTACSDLVLKDPSSLSDQARSKICSDCSRSLVTVQSYKTASYKNITFRVGDLITTSDGYAMVDGIYQFNNDRESTVCRVKLLQCLEPMPIIHYPQISKSHVLSTIYMPVSNVRGKLYTMTVGNQGTQMIVHASSMLILNE